MKGLILVILVVVLLLALALPKVRHAAWKLIGYVLSGGSAEFLLRIRSNGGDVVFVRAAWTSGLLFLLAIGLKERLTPGASWQFSGPNLLSEFGAHLDWFGAAFAATYAAYYARFSSQWTYLAGMYNQIMAMQIQLPRGEDKARERTYATWWAAFVEDAEDVHLAAKPSYAAVLAGLIGDPEVRRFYESSTVDGEERLRKLEKRLTQSLGATTFEKMKDGGAERAKERIDRMASSSGAS
jgi:hypothetical protein